MTPSEYQRLASRTEANQETVRKRIGMGTDLLGDSREGKEPLQSPIPLVRATRLLHGVIGLSGDVGELAGALERWLWYGRGFDRTNLEEELGDCLWYIALIANELETPLEEIMEKNIAKLRKRFPEKFTEWHAAEENRDRKGEREILETETDSIELKESETLFADLDETVRMRLEDTGDGRRAYRKIATDALSPKTSQNESPKEIPGVVSEEKRNAHGILVESFTCQECRNPLSDELIRKLRAGELTSSKCPQCHATIGG